MYYKIEGFAYRNKGSELELIEIDRIFKDEEPCLARYNCFNAFMSYVEVFLESIGKTYTTHEQAESDLQDFFVKNKNIDLDEKEWDKFIDIRFVFDIEKHKSDIYNWDEYSVYDGDILIHTIASKHNLNLNKTLCLDGLRAEYEFYSINGYFCSKNVVKDKKGNKIFRTPIDYSSFEYEANIW